MRVFAVLCCVALLPVALSVGCGSSLQPGGAGGHAATGGTTGQGTGEGGIPGTGGLGGRMATGGGAGTGGAAGGGGSGSQIDGGTCASIAQAYDSALAEARQCDVGGNGTCGVQVDGSLTQCAGCNQVFVNDATVLNTIKQKWVDSGCGSVPPCILLILCDPPAGGSCIAADGGGQGVCQNTYNVGP